MKKFGSQPDNDNFNNGGEQWSVSDVDGNSSTDRHFASEQIPDSSGSWSNDKVDQTGADTYSDYSHDSGRYNAKNTKKSALSKIAIGALAVALTGGIIYGVSKANSNSGTSEVTGQEQSTDQSIDDSSTEATTNDEINTTDDEQSFEFGRNTVEDTLTVDELAEYTGYNSLSEAVKSDPDKVGRRMCNWMNYNGFTISSHGYTIVYIKKTGNSLPETDYSIFTMSDGSSATMKVRAKCSENEFSILINNETLAVAYTSEEIPSTAQAEQILLEQGEPLNN